MTTLIILFIAMGCGFLLRNRRLPEIPGVALSVLVWVLLFLFGIYIGGNREITSNLSTYGILALAIGGGATLASVAAARLFVKFRKKGGGDEG